MHLQLTLVIDYVSSVDSCHWLRLQLTLVIDYVSSADSCHWLCIFSWLLSLTMHLHLTLVIDNVSSTDSCHWLCTVSSVHSCLWLPIFSWLLSLTQYIQLTLSFISDSSSIAFSEPLCLPYCAIIFSTSMLKSVIPGHYCLIFFKKLRILTKLPNLFGFMK